MAPLEPWEKVLVNEEFLTSTHVVAGCIACHGGVQSEDKDTAHTGLVVDPAKDPDILCGTCHRETVDGYATALHNTQAGYFQTMYSRSLPENHAALDEAFGNHCATCHTSCGECHISQPNNVGGGLLEGHLVVKTPPMTRTCTACHGSRVGNEYLGKHEEIPGDVHFRQGRMNCVSCHSGSSLHSNDEVSANHRYDGPESPACISCHTTYASLQDTVPQHVIHEDKLSCQVCHSLEYTSCDSCHVAVSESSGKPFYKTAGDYFTFYIGKNARKSEDRPYDYVVVRHIPIDSENYAYYGDNLLPNFDLLPTWAYATPHNIQRSTPQNQTCNSCHGNAELFLTADKVKPEELEANQAVIVDEIPAVMP